MYSPISADSQPATRQGFAHTSSLRILSDPTGERLGEVPLETRGRADRFPARDAAAQLLVASSPNWLDRPSTGDALHVVIGKRACFGYVVDIDSVRWFSHPRLARADASSLSERELRTLLYNLHSGDPSWVSEIIWETSGPISAHKAPAFPAGSTRELASCSSGRVTAQIIGGRSHGFCLAADHPPCR